MSLHDSVPTARLQCLVPDTSGRRIAYGTPAEVHLLPYCTVLLYADLSKIVVVVEKDGSCFELYEPTGWIHW
jgi:hypothetical protein